MQDYTSFTRRLRLVRGLRREIGKELAESLWQGLFVKVYSTCIWEFFPFSLFFRDGKNPLASRFVLDNPCVQFHAVLILPSTLFIYAFQHRNCFFSQSINAQIVSSDLLDVKCRTKTKHIFLVDNSNDIFENICGLNGRKRFQMSFRILVIFTDLILLQLLMSVQSAFELQFFQNSHKSLKEFPKRGMNRM